MKILELCLSDSYGGLEINMRDFSIWLKKQPDIELFLAYQKGTRIAKAFDNFESKTIIFPKKTSKMPIFEASRLSWFIESNNIDVVHVHWTNDLPLVALAKTISKIKFRFIHTRHMDLPSSKKDIYHRFIYSQIDLFFAVTSLIEEQAKAKLPLKPERIKQVYNGIDPFSLLSAEDRLNARKNMGMKSGFHIGILGRINEFKGQHLLIHALIILRKKGLEIHAWIAGEFFDKEYSDYLKTLVKDNGVGDFVHFTGFLDKPGIFLQSLDALVLGTRKETFGLVIVEGMHAEIPVIGTNAGGVPEIIDDGINGLLFEPDNAEDLANKIEYILKNKTQTNQMVRNARAKVDAMFNWENQNKQFLSAISNQTTPLSPDNTKTD